MFDLMKILSFCSSEETVNRMKRENLEWEKILMDHISDEGHVFRIHKQLSKFNNEGKP